jgi:hypothetical protein
MYNHSPFLFLLFFSRYTVLPALSYFLSKLVNKLFCSKYGNKYEYNYPKLVILCPVVSVIGYVNDV